MPTVAAAASNQRPTWISRILDRYRHARLIVVVMALLGSVALSFALGDWRDDDPLVVDTNVYVAAAALVIVALGIERLTELLIAPWVGRGSTRIDRNILIGSLSLLIGVALSGMLGLQLLALFEVQPLEGTGWWWENLAPAIEVFATGLAVSAGSKPLHDIISRLEDSTVAKKAAMADASAPAMPSGSAAGHPVPAGGLYRMAVAVMPNATLADDTQASKARKALATLLPGWLVDEASGSYLVHTTTSDPPGSSEYLGQVFSAANRLHAAGFDVTVPAALAPRQHLAPRTADAAALAGPAWCDGRGAKGWQGRHGHRRRSARHGHPPTPAWCRPRPDRDFPAVQRARQQRRPDRSTRPGREIGWISI